MKRAVELLNQMKEMGIVSDYALGGATALVYYFEPVQTQDVDVFVILPNQSNLIDLSEIYEFLKANGGYVQGEYVLIQGVPLQFLVPYNPLVEEAVTKAKEVLFMDQKLRIPPLEYLMAIMIQTGRPKDIARLEELKNFEKLYERSLLNEILTKYNLKWA